ncbi:MAG TPA: hypothetical protein ENO24_05500, partial [Chloroflexi bacterium]|nr:hypothetical protein [Chloroflexota bacterium]
MDKGQPDGRRGGLLTLTLRPSGSTIWVGPAWAVVCGAVSSGALTRDWHTLLMALLAVVLADPILSTIWALVSSDDSRYVVEPTDNPGPGTVLPSLPYTLPGSAAGRLRELLEERLAGWRWAVWPRARESIPTLGFASALALLMAAVLGILPLAVVVAFLVAAGARVWIRGSSMRLVEALGSGVLAGVPWVLGYVALAEPLIGEQGPGSLGFALLAAAAYAGVFHGCALISAQRLSLGANVVTAFQVFVVAVLILIEHPIHGGAVALLLLPQVMLQPLMLRLDDGGWYLRRVQGFAMLAMLTVALALA